MAEIIIMGRRTDLGELRKEVNAAKEKGLSGKPVFPPETVAALLDLTWKLSQMDGSFKVPYED